MRFDERCQADLVDTNQAELDSGELDAIVARLRRVARDATLQFALSVGAVVIHHFYGGDTEAWRRKGPKVASYRQLARRPDLPFSPSGLYRCVALFELCERLDAVSRWKQLGASHLRAVLRLDHEVQQRLLAQANQRGWTVQQLEQEARNAPAPGLRRGGRRCTPRVLRSMSAVKRCIEANSAAFADASEVATLSSGERTEFCGYLSRLRQTLEQLEASFHSTRPHGGSLLEDPRP